MTQQFGAVPYSDTYIQSASRDYPRTDLETIYTNCENDLQEVINSSEIPEITHDGSVNKKAAQALLAKIYLAHGWDCNTTLTDENAGTFTITSKENFEKAAQLPRLPSAAYRSHNRSKTNGCRQTRTPIPRHSSQFSMTRQDGPET